MREFGESFDILDAVADELRKLGWYFFPVALEHTEGLITKPLIARIRARIRRHGFAGVAGHAAITFSGYATDRRELYQIPEVRAFWTRLDADLDELPALLTRIPAVRYNGPSLHVSLLGRVDAMIDYPERGVYHLRVVGAERIIANGIERIRRAGRLHGLSTEQTARLIADFVTSASSL